MPSTRTPEFLGCGALNVDHLLRVERIPAPGGEAAVRETHTALGGSAANTTVGLARLGVPTGFIGRVGRDTGGQRVLDEMRREGVSTRAIRRAVGATGQALSLVDPRGERTLLVDPGANDTLTPSDAPPAMLRGARWLHLSSFACLHDPGPLRAQARMARDFRGQVSLDPGALYARRGLHALDPLLRHCDVLLPSEEEVRLLTGLPAVPGARRLLRRGPTLVAVKQGPRGATAVSPGETFHVPSLARRVVDTTGAGDAFNAGFLYGLLGGRPLREASVLGALAAAACIGKMGARAGLPRQRDLRARLPAIQGSP
ncbi:MAG: carbohydrate kinase family protein [Euryarchaeota archaeon]|nr:carbohydrate kinase family protein [Euryarchaeota archaeon]